MTNLNDSIISTIKKRSSIRTYSDKEIDVSTIKDFETFFAALPKGPFGTTANFSIINSSQNQPTPKKLGTYGFIKNAKCFIVGTNSFDAHMADYGFLFEKVVLFATYKGLDTCWLGGTFSENDILKHIPLNEHERVPAVISMGYKTPSRGTIDRLVRWGAKSNKRKPWSSLFFNESFNQSLIQENLGDFETILEMVRLAPSACNIQPWRIVKDEANKAFHFFLQRTKGYDPVCKTLKKADLQMVDMGIALSHFELTAKKMNKKGFWKITDHNIKAIPHNCSYLISWCLI